MASKSERKTVADFPELVAQWHPTKNGEVTPDQVGAGSGKKFWWTCPKGPDHEWKTAVEKRSVGGTGCPFCAGRRVSVTNALAYTFPEVAGQWHPTKNGDLTPKDIVAGSNKKVWWQCPKGPDHEWQTKLVNRTALGRGCPACAGKQASVTNSLASLFPDVAVQWHPTKNGDLTPKDIVAGSNKKVWWQCPKGPDHSWKTDVYSRTGLGGGCPACSSHQVSVTNSLATLFPEVAAQWHPTKNGELAPQDVTAKTSKRYWWKCPEGPDHEWPAITANRTKHGRGCPFCSNQRVLVRNSLATLFPDVAAQWHPAKNGQLTPDKLAPGSNKKYWWKCPEGSDHEWLAAPAKRAGEGTSCPYCAGQKVSITNSLARLFPYVAAQWHPTKNGNLTAQDVVAGSHKKYWWICGEGPDHVWRAALVERTSEGAGCRACGGRQVSVTNSLATVSPDVAAQWHPTKNGELKPENIVAGSNKKVWWQCPMGPDHEWQTNIVNRTGAGTGCPACAGKQVSVTNSLTSLFPDVAAQWHPTKNGNLTAQDVVAGSSKKCWWMCPEGPDHEWRAALVERTSGETGCRACRGFQASVTNSLASLFPEIAAEWHPNKNGALTPDQIVAGSEKDYWWQCRSNSQHDWPARPRSRTQLGSACPYCHILPRSRQEVRLAFELAYHFPVEHEMHKVKVGEKLWDVDICIPDKMLLIEFDGEFWHRDKADKDKAKARHLRKAGWTVVRVREAPLKKLSKWNIVVPRLGEAHVVATQLLQHLQSVCGIEIPRMDERLAADGPLCADQAEEYIQKLLAEKEAAL